MSQSEAETPAHGFVSHGIWSPSEPFVQHQLPTPPAAQTFDTVSAPKAAARGTGLFEGITTSPEKIRKRRQEILLSRSFLTDLARIAEGLIGFDLTEFASSRATDDHMHISREQPFGVIPFQVGAMTEDYGKADDKVRRIVGGWSVSIGERYRARVVQWIDSGVDYEKPAAVLELHPGGAEDPEWVVLVVCLRGSKTFNDWMCTNPNHLYQSERRRVPTRPVIPSLISKAFQWHQADRALVHPSALSEISSAGDDTPFHPVGRAHFMPFIAYLPSPAVASGMWKAYAGVRSHDRMPQGPRKHIQKALEDALKYHAEAGRPVSVLVSGHSLGGTLATLCAVDLVRTALAPPGAYGSLPHVAKLVQSAPVTCITFGSSRSFNPAFRAYTAQLQRQGKLTGLRVISSGDMVPRLPAVMVCPYTTIPFLGVVHAIAPRLALQPQYTDASQLLFTPESHPNDADQALTLPHPMGHTCHSYYLAGEIAEADPARGTVSADTPWPAAEDVLAAQRNCGTPHSGAWLLHKRSVLGLSRTSWEQSSHAGSLLANEEIAPSGMRRRSSLSGRFKQTSFFQDPSLHSVAEGSEASTNTYPRLPKSASSTGPVSVADDLAPIGLPLALDANV